MSTKKKQDAVLVAAIDFGTTYSGYAYSFKGTFDKDPTKIFTPQKWEGDGQLSQKTVACVLFNEKKEFVAFGYPAEKKYITFGQNKEHHKCFFFKQFKMMLHNKEIHRNTEIEAQNGQKMQAMTVFSESIRYLKKHLLDSLTKTTGSSVDEDKIHWVLTVPAIWSDSAKQFMRESAEEAGIEGDQLTIALEPEAASLYCQLVNEQQVKERMIAPDGKNISQPGTKFMCIDLGGGTADITVHKRQPDGSTAELHQPTGDHLGGTKVDLAFKNMLQSIVGADVLNYFSQECPDDYLNMTQSFERSKRQFNPEHDDALTVTIPIKLSEFYTKETVEDVKDAVKRSRHSKEVEWCNDKVIIKKNKMTEIFNTCATKLVEHIKYLMKQKEVKGTDIFLMVGGFSECDFMQQAIRDNFNGKKMIIPPDTGLAVVKGAVIFGHRPVAVASRIAKYTYGTNISPPFDPEKHPESHRVKVTGQDRCRDVFKIYIKKGDEIATGVGTSGKHISLKPGQDEMLLKLYVSEKPDPVFVDEDKSHYAGRVVVKLPKMNINIKVLVTMIFGDTEMTVTAEEQETHTKYNSYFDFL